MSSFGCRSCGGSDISPIVSLGETPLANSLLRKEQLNTDEARFPLDVVICDACSLVQITETVPPERLFSDYHYFSSFSDGMLKNAEELTGRLCRERRLDSRSFVVEIASNDGYLLQNYLKNGLDVLGIEPAANVARVAEMERQIPTMCRFFGEKLAAEIAQNRRADVIHANNVLAHVPDLGGFTRGIATLLADDGICVIEVPSLVELIQKTEFDTVYHEHLSYFSLTTLERLFERNALRVVDVESIAIHGGSLRVFAKRADGTAAPSEAVAAMRRFETELGIDSLDFYRGFASRVEQVRSDLCALIDGIVDGGERVAVYGASAKGSTLMNYVGLSCDQLDFVVDRSSHKQGFFTPGTHLPIFAPPHLLETMPEYVLLATWNFRDEILEQQAEYRARGGKFIVPIPFVEVI